MMTYQIHQRDAELRGEQRGKQLGIAIGEQRGEQRGKQLGIAIGEQRGKQLGKQLGIAIGEQRGEQRGKQETAKNLLLCDVAEDIIVRATGLSHEEIQEIRLTISH